jgi:hypothetical protein
MTHLDNFKKRTDLIGKYGEEKAHLIWTMGLYLDFPDLNQLASESLTDGADDKKIDFIRLDIDSKKLIVVQGTFASKGAVYKAKSNKASDLNTAFAWILSGDIENLRTDENGKFENSLKEIALDIRLALKNKDIEEIEILYVHNMAESKNVANELNTVKLNLTKLLNDPDIIVSARELGIENVERIFRLKETAIVVKEKIVLPEKKKFEEVSSKWKASIFTVRGKWLSDLYAKYDDNLFSANYRNFLGISKRGRKKINSGIKQTVETKADDFWAYNNGITILTTKHYPDPENPNETILEGISIINGAQTTGSIAHSNPATLDKVRVLCRVIESADDETINSIIEFNNTQNEITTWDKYSKNPEQERIAIEFNKLGYTYSFKRGFDNNSELSIEVVAQPVSALHGNYLEAGSGKNNIFEKTSLYDDAFHNVKSKHLLLAYCLVKAVDERCYDLKTKSDTGKCTSDENNQLSLLRFLRFKYFLLSIIGDCMENIVGESVDLKNVSFANGVAGSTHNSIPTLIENCKPLVSLVLAFVSKTITGNFSEIMYDKAKYIEIKTNVSNTIDTVKLTSEINPFSLFAKLIAPKG